VFPADADLEKGRISILSPLGTALLGYRAGDVVTWERPRGTRRLRIEDARVSARGGRRLSPVARITGNAISVHAGSVGEGEARPFSSTCRCTAETNDPKEKPMTREQILITREDKKRLQHILPRLAGDEYADREDLVLLADEIERATEVEQDAVPPDVVTLNSTVRVTDLESGTAMDYTIVMPGEANYDAGKISSSRRSERRSSDIGWATRSNGKSRAACDGSASIPFSFNPKRPRTSER
jgi:transcription elongation GreA/GreB family factor